MLETTLCYLERGDRYLMLHRVKKERDVNAGKWVGVGGKFEEGESPEMCAAREIREETGLTPSDLRRRGIVTFVSDRWPSERMHLFTASAEEGQEGPCDEGDLAWIGKRELLSLPMWEGDRIFLRLLEEGRPFFELELRYEGERLAYAALDGKEIGLPYEGR